MKTTPVKGTCEYLPKEAALRERMERVIAETYSENGFERIYTPILEDIENLEQSEGGENLSLIFKILKRGEKLQTAIDSGDLNSLADCGLRYDLTLPLARFYANNRSRLLSPFKCIQIGRSYRAEQPQKGRLREFKQCDIDILGSSSVDCEAEIIAVTACALSRLGLCGVTVKINDRALLNGVLKHAGFDEKKFEEVCVILDKADKIGIDGVCKALYERFDEAPCRKLIEVIHSGADLKSLSGLQGCEAAADSVSRIMDTVKKISGGAFDIEFDFSLIRGQGYYSGAVFEIKSNKYKSSIAGGGRYDNMIGKFIGETVPAVGFSIGFERIFDILSESGFEIPGAKKKIVLFYSEDEFAEGCKKAEGLRDSYSVLLYQKPKKLGKAMKKFEESGFAGRLVLGQDDAPVLWGSKSTVSLI